MKIQFISWNEHKNWIPIPKVITLKIAKIVWKFVRMNNVGTYNDF